MSNRSCRRAVIMVSLALLALIMPLAADADHDRNRIDEVMAGFAGDATIQFVELQMLEDGHQCQATAGGQEPPPGGCLEAGFGASLLFFDGAGNQVSEFLFPSNTPVGLAGRSILIGTAAFAALGTTPAPDFIMPPLVIPGSGKVCYRSRPGTFLHVNQCLSYGSFTGDTEGFGKPAPALPTAGNVSLRRISDDDNNAVSFTLGVPAPRNNAQVTGTTPVSTATLSLNRPSVQPGQTLTVGVDVSHGNHLPPGDLYVGAILPGGEVVVLLSATGSVAGTVALQAPAGATPTLEVSPGFTLNQPQFATFTFPAAGVPFGTYQVFVALLRQVALDDNHLDGDDVMALAVQSFVFEH